MTRVSRIENTSAAEHEYFAAKKAETCLEKELYKTEASSTTFEILSISWHFFTQIFEYLREGRLLEFSIVKRSAALLSKASKSTWTFQQRSISVPFTAPLFVGIYIFG